MKQWMPILLPLLLVLPATVAAAGPSRDQPPRSRSERLYSHSLDDVVSGVRRRNPGKVLSADTVKQGDRSVHRIRILNEQGRVRGLRFDADTGKPLPRPKRRPRRR